MTTSKSLVVALWANAALLGVIAVSLLRADGQLPSFVPVAAAQNQAPIAGGAGVFVMPAQMSQNTWGCYLLDVDSQTLATYNYKPGDRQLQLVAARSYKYDRRLENWNTSPAPSEVRELLERENRVRQGVQPAPAAPPAPPAGVEVAPN